LLAGSDGGLINCIGGADNVAWCREESGVGIDGSIRGRVVVEELGNVGLGEEREGDVNEVE
jgi:hypothetical protein